MIAKELTLELHPELRELLPIIRKLIGTLSMHGHSYWEFDGLADRKLVINLREELESIKSAFGEHPDSEVDLPQRVFELRNQVRAQFHAHTRDLLSAEVLGRRDQTPKSQPIIQQQVTPKEEISLLYSGLEDLLVKYGGQDLLTTLARVIKSGEGVGQGHIVADIIQKLAEIEW